MLFTGILISGIQLLRVSIKSVTCIDEKKIADQLLFASIPFFLLSMIAVEKYLN